MNSNQFKPVKFKKYDATNFKAMNVFDTRHNYSVQESLHLIATPPLSLGKVSWIFKDQDYQESSLRKSLFLPFPPTSTGLLFSHMSQKYNNNRSSCGSVPHPPLLKEQPTVWTLLTFWNQ